ncbi:DUF4145 domain-containing protein [Serratia proteamaculans]|uniref:DUF4145 domain-containing protein n=1 Tax=Serratia proteamaculans TaxID=28151 RepID=UPI002178E7C3|nr:DUF4145 domain-containing protein [Serratia proteamaculans]CAI1571995.1 Uncharacterised protein [Serratia proteamaculans]
MSQLVHDCPRCGSAHITFNVKGELLLGYSFGWQENFEVFCECLHCHKGTIFHIAKTESRFEGKECYPEKIFGVINDFYRVSGHVTSKDFDADEPPEHLPDNIEKAYVEGAKCMTIGCYNAAATMFRLCLDFATKSLIPDNENGGPAAKIKRSLGLRMDWLFDNGILPNAFRELADCIKDDGNDGAHEGILDEASAIDLQEFTEALLERLYTEPTRIQLAKERRAQRHAK